MKVDIIGGGLSGLATALSIKKHNPDIDVCIHEKHSKIGFNTDGRQCGEAHNIEKEWLHWKPSKKGIAMEVLHAETVIGDKTLHFQRDPGTAWILDRPSFIADIGKSVQKLGVTICLAERIKDLNDLDGDVIVDASGCPSIVKKILGFDRGLKGTSYQQTLMHSNWYDKNKIKIIFDGRFGYYWIFPRREKYQEVNIGVGYYGNFMLPLKDIVEEFKKKHNITGEVVHRTGGLIPMGFQPPLKYRNILFVGDAGVGTFPLSGQGIYRALLSGDVAGKCIASGNISKYPYEIRRLFIKWDIIGTSVLRLNYVLRSINNSLVLSFLKRFFTFADVIHI